MKVIVPCAGKSSRFPNMRPKWMLTHPSGDLMVKKVVEGLDAEPKDIVVTMLAEHEEKYSIIKGLKESLGSEIQVVVLDKQTSSQSETVYLTIKKLGLKEGFFIKDSDSLFESGPIEEKYNYVCYSDLQDYESINPGNKSYIKMNTQNIITDIAEKLAISRFFNVGGYYFTSPLEYIKSYEELSKKYENKELYISHIIENMLGQGGVFFGKYVKKYTDWGTWAQWSEYKSRFRVLFVDVDGVVFQNGAQYHKPHWEDAKPIAKNVERIKALSQDERVQIFFVTARPESMRKMTEQRLESLGIRHSGLIMGCMHAKRILVNDFSATLPYPSCEAINILRDSEDLEKYI
jgi:hypothetical protein